MVVQSESVRGAGHLPELTIAESACPERCSGCVIPALCCGRDLASAVPPGPLSFSATSEQPQAIEQVPEWMRSRFRAAHAIFQPHRIGMMLVAHAERLRVAIALQSGDCRRAPDQKRDHGEDQHTLGSRFHLGPFRAARPLSQSEALKTPTAVALPLEPGFINMQAY
jgi:hypothetical protein